MPSGETNPFRILGAFAPSSRRLAHAMTRYVPTHGERILEVGAGSGAITKCLITKMLPSQSTDVVEIFPKLTALLRARFHDVPSLTIYCSDILQFDARENSYDHIICSLPFNAFSPTTTMAIVARLLDLAKHGAIMSFFEYKVLQGVARLVLPEQRREEFLASRKLIELLCQRYKFDEAVVNLNIPQAYVHYLRIDKENDRPEVFRRA